jgi:hypothetical protein
MGTHILRRRNNDRQLFSGCRAEFGLVKEFKEIEYGLAVIRQMIIDKLPRLFTAALRYNSCILAS